MYCVKRASVVMVVIVFVLGQVVLADVGVGENEPQADKRLHEPSAHPAVVEQPLGLGDILLLAALPIHPADLSQAADALHLMLRDAVPGHEPGDAERDGVVALGKRSVPRPVLGPLGPPRVEGNVNSGCLDGPAGEPLGPCAEDEVELTVEGNTLCVVHRNATYNCCADDIVISLSVEGSLIRLTEEEIITVPCYCICCYNVEATIVDLAPGPYTVLFCWYDYDTAQEECYVEEIVIPGSGNGKAVRRPPGNR